MKKSFLLTTLDEGCSRRALLRGLGLACAAAMIPGAAGCMQQGSDLPTANTTSCGGSVCIDLAQAGNTALTAVGGAMLVDIATDTVMVIRASDTAVVALSAICTHAGCSMNFDASTNRIVCPCHGSQFDEQGNVVQGPARRPVKVYTASLANNVITVAA